MQGGGENKHEADPGKNAVADRPFAADVFSYDMPSRAAGYSAIDDEGYRARFSPDIEDV